LTPTASVPKPAAIISNITEPINDNLIHAIGAPTVTNSDKSPVSTTIEGPMEVIKLLFIALFICVCVSPIFVPVAYDFLAKINACIKTNDTAKPAATHIGMLLAIFK